ncbi:MAG: MFS transporter, partial [Henriciella sp.]
RSCFGIAIGLGSVTIMSMIGDIVDDNEVKTGLRQEGLFYSARAFFAKASYSVGHFVAGIILDVFVRLPTGAIPGELDGGLLVRMGITAGPVMAVSATISWFIYRRYNLSRSDHAKIISELEQRAATKAEKLAE